MFLEFFPTALRAVLKVSVLTIFAKTIDTPSPPGLMLSLILMESLILTGRTFPKGGTWKYAYYYTNKPNAHSNHQPSLRSTPCWFCSRSCCPLNGQAGLGTMVFFLIVIVRIYNMKPTLLTLQCQHSINYRHSVISQMISSYSLPTAAALSCPLGPRPPHFCRFYESDHSGPFL